MRDAGPPELVERLAGARSGLEERGRLGDRLAGLDEREVLLEPAQQPAVGHPAEWSAAVLRDDEDRMHSVAHERALGLKQRRVSDTQMTPGRMIVRTGVSSRSAGVVASRRAWELMTGTLGPGGGSAIGPVPRLRCGKPADHGRPAPERVERARMAEWTEAFVTALGRDLIDAGRLRAQLSARCTRARTVLGVAPRDAACVVSRAESRRTADDGRVAALHPQW